jgi:hypothetical protein
MVVDFGFGHGVGLGVGFTALTSIPTSPVDATLTVHDAPVSRFTNVSQKVTDGVADGIGVAVGVDVGVGCGGVGRVGVGVGFTGGVGVAVGIVPMFRHVMPDGAGPHGSWMLTPVVVLRQIIWHG